MSRVTAVFAVAILFAAAAGAPAMADEFTEPDRRGTIKVIDRGQGPHETLRYDWTTGESRAVRFTISRAETMVLNGQTVAQFNTVPFIIDTDVTVASAFADGTFEVATEIVRTELLDASPQAAEAGVLAASLETLVGGTIRERFDDRGVRRHVEITDPLEEGFELHPARDAVPTVIQHGPVQLPNEPIGVGGVWEIVTVATGENGIEIAANARLTIVAIEESGTLLIESSEDADDTVTPQRIDAAELAPGAQMVVEAVDARSDGISRLDLGSPMPGYIGKWSIAFRAGLEAAGDTAEIASMADTELSVVPDGLRLPSAAE